MLSGSIEAELLDFICRYSNTMARCANYVLAVILWLVQAALGSVEQMVYYYALHVESI